MKIISGNKPVKTRKILADYQFENFSHGSFSLSNEQTGFTYVPTLWSQKRKAQWYDDSNNHYYSVNANPVALTYNYILCPSIFTSMDPLEIQYMGLPFVRAPANSGVGMITNPPLVTYTEISLWENIETKGVLYPGKLVAKNSSTGNAAAFEMKKPDITGTLYPGNIYWHCFALYHTSTSNTFGGLGINSRNWFPSYLSHLTSLGSGTQMQSTGCIRYQPTVPIIASTFPSDITFRTWPVYGETGDMRSTIVSFLLEIYGDLSTTNLRLKKY